MSASSARVTTWASWAEWQKVHKWLLSPDPAERARGVQRVHTWRSRGNLPVAVDVTAAFVEAMLNDPTFNSATQTPRSDYELQLMYSMCVVRLVNGITDQAQNRAVAGSIHHLVQELEWPVWFVELRHQASHQKMPSLQSLRMGAKEALFLLFQRFWRPQEEQLARRGRARVPRLGQSTEVIPAVRDRKLIDRKLRTLVALSARKRKADALDQSGGGSPGDSPASKARKVQVATAGAATNAAFEVAKLAVDESKLLERVLATILEGEPHPDGRQVDAVRLLCTVGSDNFALRLAREVCTRALGWEAGHKLVPASDHVPSLRNICDAHKEAPSEPDANFSPKFDELEADRMLTWLQALLGQTGSASNRNRPRTAFVKSVTELSPWLRRVAIQRAAAADASSSALLARVTRVWEVFAAAGVDSGTKHFMNLFDPGSSSSSGSDNTVALSPDDVTTLLSERKRCEGSAAIKAREPWTAIGTVWNPQTLEVRCAWEQPKKTPLVTEEMVSMWNAWALDGAENDQDKEEEPGAQAAAEAAVEESACKDVRADSSPQHLGKSAPFVDEKASLDQHDVLQDAAFAKGAEAGFLARLAKLFGSPLRPFTSV